MEKIVTGIRTRPYPPKSPKRFPFAILAAFSSILALPTSKLLGLLLYLQRLVFS